MLHHHFLDQLVYDLSAATPEMFQIEHAKQETILKFRELDIVYTHDSDRGAEYLRVIFESNDLFMVGAQEIWSFCFQKEPMDPYNQYLVFRIKKEYGPPVFPTPTNELEELAKRLYKTVLKKIKK